MTQRTLPIELLEKQAATQRERLHDSVKELRETVRDHIDLNHLLKGYFLPAAALAAVAALSLGYSFGSIFRRQ